MVSEVIFFTSLNNKVTINTFKTSSNCTLISTLDCSNGVNVSSFQSNCSDSSHLNIQQICRPVSQCSVPLTAHPVSSEQQVCKPVGLLNLGNACYLNSTL